LLRPDKRSIAEPTPPPDARYYATRGNENENENENEKRAMAQVAATTITITQTTYTVTQTRVSTAPVSTTTEIGKFRTWDGDARTYETSIETNS